ncbi:iron export ABC transporter permease subunit FetB [Alkalihalobacillus sp. AL-G]|uniref:ABC transporter permease n=1 Tax=Alkalihalobacillus sp. AL-G TaxID=2926399 RepID=UPI002729F579|nr:iron export ABC transporter permease subunit FetB [Alkalihalobacillus sp. AL-G]WLD92058.1 iron export ABC transporter permease subunit FetB [Alkalihalobacillus sp. AL-G]
METNEITNLSLTFIIVFVIIPVSLSYWFSLGLSKSILWASFRGVIQLILIGYVLTFLFSIPDWQGITLWVSVMVIIASINAAKRGGNISNVWVVVFITIAITEVFVLALWLGFGYIAFTPEKVIPISGMVIGNSMIAIGLALERLQNEFKEERGRVLAALSLGATPKQSSSRIIRATLKAALIPNIDGLKTIGLVQLPGMMTGLILGGVSPLDAVKFQIIISLSIFVSVAVCAMLVTLILYKNYFNDKMQLIELQS